MRVTSETCSEGVKGLNWPNRAGVELLWVLRSVFSLRAGVGSR